MNELLDAWFNIHGAQLLSVLATGSTMILMATVIANQCLSRISAATRFTIWQIAIVSLGILPLGWLCLPQIPLGLLDKSSKPPIEAGAFGVADLPVQRPDSNAAKFASSNNRSACAPGHPRSPATDSFSNAAIHSTFNRISFRQLATVVWLGFATMFLLRLMFNHLRTAFVTHRITGSKPANSIGQVTLPPNVSLCYSKQVKIPYTVGILRKRIVLPVGAKHWNTKQCRMVLKHEFAHIERNDVFWQLVISVFKSIYWFQPAIWWVARESSIAREQACDDRVIASGEDRIDYATTLVQLAACISGRPIFLAGALSMSQKPIERRLSTILCSATRRSATNRWLACFVAAIALLIATSVCSLRPFQPVPAAAQVVQEQDSKPTESLPTQAVSSDISHLRQEKPDFYKLDSNDVLGIYIEGVLKQPDALMPMQLPRQAGDPDLPPAIGYPVPVRADGTIAFPPIDPINVKGKTILQVEKLVSRAYRGGAKPIIDAKARVIVTLLEPRTYCVFVVRQKGEKVRRFVMQLPAYQNDVLNAISMSGGLNRGTEFSVLHTDNTPANLTRDFQISQFYKSHSPKEFPVDAIPTFEQAAKRLAAPEKIKMSTAANFDANDAVLYEGDIVYVKDKPAKSNSIAPETSKGNSE